MTLQELLLQLGPLVPHLTDYYDPVGVQRPDGTLDHWPTQQTSNSTRERFRWGAEEDEKGNKIAPLSSTKHYVAIMPTADGWLQVRDYPPGMLVSDGATERTENLPVNSPFKDWQIVEWVQAAAKAVK